MNQQTMRNLTLFDLLARSWRRPAPVESVRFSRDDAVAAFTCADGTVAIARTADAEPPEERIRVSGDLGQSTIRPREKAPEPLIAPPALADHALPVAAFGRSDFIVGGADGRVLALTAAGEAEDTRLAIGGAVVALDHAERTATTAASDGANVFLMRAHGQPSKLPLGGGSGIAALAFSPSGKDLAVSHPDGVSLWSVEGDASLRATFKFAGRPLSLAWSADGRWLACPLASGGFGLVDVAAGTSGIVADFPAGVRTVTWSRPADALLASGAFRVAGWSMKSPPLDGNTDGALVTGRAGLVVVEAVAAHPQKQIVAAGYANGQIVVAQIGARDELLVKPSGGSVTALAWSADGRHLAAGAADGTASLITFPAQLFK